MKRIYEICKTEDDARRIVKYMIEEGYSVYRQGVVVYIDDGGVDEG